MSGYLGGLITDTTPALRRGEDPFSQDRALCAAWFNPYLTDEDRDWLRRQFEFAEVRVPTVDISWITTERGT